MDEVQASDSMSGAELRQASFPQARRGYDRRAVHAFLDRIADWVEAQAGGSNADPGLTSELEKVGERTAGILTAAEEAAAKLRREAKEYADEFRQNAEEETRKTTLNASQKADELIAEAESKAEGIIDEAIARRRKLNQSITSLTERRDEIADEVQRLADELLGAVDAVRAGEPIDQPEELEAVEGEEDPDATPPEGSSLHGDGEDAEAERSRLERAGFEPAPRIGGEPTELEPPDERETTVHETRGG